MSFEPTTENVFIYNEGWKDAKADNEKLIDALRKARKYIRTVEAQRVQPCTSSMDEFISILNAFTDGDEVEAIEDALAELGVIC